MTVVVLVYTFRLVHAWMHGLPTDTIRADLMEAVSDHHLWREEYATDRNRIPGSEPVDDDDVPPKRPRLKLVD